MADDQSQLDDDYKSDQTQKAEDDEAPFSAPDDVNQGIGDTHPATDSNVDSTELYNEGLGEAAEAFDPEKAQPTEDDETQLMADTH